MDTGVTKDGVLVVDHDSYINAYHCSGPGLSTALPPAVRPHGPLIKDLTLAEVKAYDCGLRDDPQYGPGQVASGVQRIPTLQEVLDLAKAKGDDSVRFNIETKLSPLNDDTVPYDLFTAKLVKTIQDNDLQDRADIQSFDWRTIRLSKRIDPSIETVALVWQYSGTDCDDLDDECSLEAVVGDPSVTSPWTGGLDWWDFRDLGKLVKAAKADVVSADWQVHDPNQVHRDSDDNNVKTDPGNYHGPTVPELQDDGLRVVPYTINDEADMQRVIDLGVDGIISDFPERLQLVAQRNGLE
jgi:glycerophosphoryl diester phosphodiesterase